MPPGFFVPTDGSFVPRPHAHSPWGADLLHGRLLAGLAVRLVEQEHGSTDLQLCRVTADLFSAVPMVPVRLEATRVRDGRRIRMVDVVVTAEGRTVLRVSALLLASSLPPPGSVWGAGAWDAPVPEEPPGAVPGSGGTGEQGIGEQDTGFPELRLVGPALGNPSGPARAWVHDRWPLVDGEPMTPLQRAVLAADLANPVGNWGSEGMGYINADLTAHVVRPPVGAWIGIEVVDHQAGSGRAMAMCRLHDRTGPIGSTTVTAMVPSGPAQAGLGR